LPPLLARNHGRQARHGELRGWSKFAKPVNRYGAELPGPENLARRLNVAKFAERVAMKGFATAIEAPARVRLSGHGASAEGAMAAEGTGAQADRISERVTIMDKRRLPGASIALPSSNQGLTAQHVRTDRGIFEAGRKRVGS